MFVLWNIYFDSFNNVMSINSSRTSMLYNSFKFQKSELFVKSITKDFKNF